LSKVYRRPRAESDKEFFNHGTHELHEKIRAELELRAPAVWLLYFGGKVTHFYRRMIRFGLGLFAVFLASAITARAATTNDPPDFKEVFELVRTHLKGATDAS